MPNSKKYKGMILFLCIILFSYPSHAQTKVQIKKEVKDTQSLKNFEGYYQFENDKSTFLQITAKGNNLILKQLWDGKEIVFEQESELEFFNEEESFPLKFTKGQDGAITQVLAFDKDVWDKVKDYKPVIK
jgi:hypothetical protein